MRIAIVGDVHGEFSTLRAVENLGPDLIIQCGDLGFWPRWPTVGLELEAFTPQVPIRFCDGNHEDLETLFAHRVPGESPRAHEVKPGLFWQDRGSTLTLPDGRVVLFVGGAWSFDDYRREPGVDWFPDMERVSEEDLSRLPDCKVDIVVSHTCPVRFRVGYELPPVLREEQRRKFNDGSMDHLDLVFEKYRPRLWVFGHWHWAMSGEHEGCKWIGLHRVDKCGGREVASRVHWLDGPVPEPAHPKRLDVPPDPLAVAMAEMLYGKREKE